ncbi:MAG: IS30 family transposase [Erysipelotrichaceae bacterium]|nr:IS30 family transposase [Erysipelotrichaceae bacterium]
MTNHNNYSKHLTSEERKIIQTGIENGSSKASIAETLGKDPSTIGKEIKAHRILSHKCTLPLDCSVYKYCTHGRNCSTNCVDFVPFSCKRRDRSPGACNGCKTYIQCRHDKYRYNAFDAQSTYKDTLIDSRQGVNLTLEEVKKMGEVIKPLLDQGLSPYVILQLHPELNITERTLYTYINDNIFSVVGISNIDLRRKVSRRLPKQRKNTVKKRQDRSYLKGREYKDFVSFVAENRTSPVVQMDTVYNDGSNGPFIQTFKFIDYGFMFAIYHDTKTSEDMVNGLDLLDCILGEEAFNQNVQILLTDRGPEFQKAELLENRENKTRRTRVFYCDPMQSGQKGSLENIHVELRYILPKEVDLRKLGLNSQEDLNLVLSHINSYPREALHHKSPIEMMEFLNSNLMQRFYDFGIKKIEKDKVVLKPYLLKK